MIRRILTLFCLLVLTVVSPAQGPNDPNEGFRIGSGSTPGVFTLSWWGHAGKNYFLEQSDDLLSGWNYLPMMESGANGLLQWGLTSSASKGFFRLQLDTDLSGLPDSWEQAYYGHLGVEANGLAPRGDGLSNLQSLFQGLNPLDSYNGTPPAAGQNLPVASLAATPTGTLTAPATVTLTATASVTSGTIARVDFYQDGSYVASDTSSPYSYALSNVTPGNYQFRAVAVDSAGFSGLSNVVHLPVVPPVTTADSNRYFRGIGTDPTYRSYVVAVDFQKGVLLNPMGTVQYPSGSLPWFLRIAKTTSYQIGVSGSSVAYPTPFENPVVAFGAEGGGSPLYAGQSYSFGVGSGSQYLASPQANDFLLSVYQKNALSGGQTNVAPTALGGSAITLPRPGTAAWTTFAENGYVQTQTINDGGGNLLFRVSIQYAAGETNTDQWGQSGVAPLLVTVTSNTTDYYLKVSYKGIASVNSLSYWMAVDDAPPTYPGNYSVSFTMDFQARPPWRSTYVDQPHFAGIPLPSAYQGKTLDELLHSTPPVIDTLTAPAGGTLLTIDSSPELRRHPVLDKFVADMGNDPLALANYVLNEIELTDSISYNENGTITEQSINAGGVNRGALATLLEGQGSPTEQCALLVYLLRQAGYQSEYVFPQQRNGVLMLDQQLSKLLRMQLKGAQDPAGNSNVPRLIPVNYPWVATYIGGKWIHIFPWLKDTAVEEGQDVYPYLPEGYQTGKQWLNRYLLGDPTIRSLSTEYDNPGALFPLFIKNRLATQYPGTSIDQLGVTFYNRRNYFTNWNDLPRPWQTPTIANTDVKESLSAVDFDTIKVTIYKENGGTKTWLMETGDLRMVDLHNRRFLLYAVQDVSIPAGVPINAHTLKLSLEAFRPDTEANAAPNPSFTTTDSLLNKQLKTAALSSLDDALTFAIQYKRHRAIGSASTHWSSFLGVSNSLEISDERPLRKGDMAAFVLNYGRVTSGMLNVHAQRYQSAQQQIASTGATTVDPEIAQGIPAYLMGMSYYYNISQTKQQLLDLTKTNILSFFGHGFAKFGPQRNSDGTLFSNGQINLLYPKLDMSFQRTAWANNGTLHPDSGEAQWLPANDWATVFIGEVSAQEHRTINKFFQKSAAISTVKLLDLSRGLQLTNVHMAAGTNGCTVTSLAGLAVGQTVTGANIVGGTATILSAYVSGVTGMPALTLSANAIATTSSAVLQVATSASNIIKIDKSNYSAVTQPPWSNYYSVTINGTTINRTLAEWAGYHATNPTGIYKSIADAFVFNGNPRWDADYVQVLLTPGPITAFDASGQPFYQGMGAFVTGQTSYGAFISDNLNVMNGGWGLPNYTKIDTTPSSFSLWSLQPTNDYSFSLVNNFNQSSSTSLAYTPTSISIPNANTGYSQISTGAWTFSDPVTNLSLNLGAASLSYTPPGSGNTATANLWQTILNYQPPSATSNYSTMHSQTTGLATGILDPVHAVTGEFYVDALDLRLSGPMPLDIRRNYGSQNLADGQFGYGWKLAYVPWLVVSLDANQDLIYATEMDGSVVAYRRQTSPNTRWIPTATDNPQLTNVAGDSAGSLTNVFNNYIDKTTISGFTYYTLNGVDGSKRTFQVRSYPTPNTAGQTDGLTRERPYLQTWQDNRGNFYTFKFYGDDAGENNSTPGYGSLKRIISSNGSFVGFNIDAYGHIVEAFTSDGRRLYYKYDDYGDLVQVTLPDASTIQYQYQHQPNTTGGGFYSEHLLVEERKPQGRVLVNVYDNATSRRVTQQKATVGVNATTGATNFTPITNATFAYKTPAGADRTDTPNTPISGYTVITDVNGQPTKYEYTDSLITKVTDALTQTVNQTWYTLADETNSVPGAYRRSLRSRTDKRGLLTEYKYDAKGNLTEKKVTGDLTGAGNVNEVATTSSLYNTRHLVTETTDPLGNSVHYLYEHPTQFYLPTSIERRAPGGSVSTTALAYENTGAGSVAAYGLLQQETKAVGTDDAAVTTYTNDARGFVTKITRPTGTIDPPVVVDYGYNQRGELTSETDALGRVTKYAYDGRGNRIWSEWRDESGALVSWQYDYFNQNGEIEWSDGPRYSPEDYVLRRYDGAGRPSEELKWRSEANATGTGVQAVAGLDDAYASTFFIHDAFGNLKEIRKPQHDASKAHNPPYYSTTMQYDWLGQMTGRQRRDGDASAAVIAGESFTYEPGGEVWQHTNPLGGVTTRLYTGLGKLKSQADSVTGVVLEWRYDLLGRTVREKLSNGSYWTTEYNDYLRKVTRCFYSVANTLLATEVTMLDRRGNVISKLDSENHLFTTTYDRLNRVKTTVGPEATATSAQEGTENTYGAAGKVVITTDALGQKTHTVADMLGRVVSVEVKDKKNTVIRRTSTAYAPDGHSVTATAGLGAGAVQTTTFTNTFGQPVLVRYGNGTPQILAYDGNGNRTASQDEDSHVTWQTYDALNRLKTQTLPGGAATTFVYDAAGNVLERQMPGGQTHVQTFDAASRKLTEKLLGLGTPRAETRSFGFSYYTSGANIGLPQAVSDPRGVTFTTTYDDFLRPATVTADGAQAVQDQTTTYGYDTLNRLTSVAQSFANPSTGPPTLVARTYDGYGQIVTETVSISDVVQNGFAQTWDGAGRRVSLTSTLAAQGNGAGRTRSFGYWADGQMKEVNAAGSAFTFSYDLNGLLTSRQNSGRTHAVTGRDARGRVLTQNNTIGGGTPLSETQTWNGNPRRASYTANRTGSGVWNETRNYSYNGRGQLAQETDAPSAGGYADFLYGFDFDLGIPTTGDGLGVRTLAMRRTNPSDYANFQPGSWLTYDPNLFGGSTFGADNFRRPTTEVQYPAVLNQYYGAYTDYDAVGQVEWRDFRTSSAQYRQQDLVWDADGRLREVYQADAAWQNGFLWQAIYDGLGRRLRTVKQSVVNYVLSGPVQVIDSFYDPQVEFLEVGVAVDGVRTWKLHGPDLNGHYGGLQGIGGLEAVIDESTGGVISLVSDAFGNVVGTANGSTLTWNPARVGSYGVLPGSTAPVFGESGVTLAAATLWRSQRIDPTGLYYLGARYYEPLSARFVSTDPLGHGASMDLYSYANGDPCNGLDPTGRVGVSGSLSGNASSRASTDYYGLHISGSLYPTSAPSAFSGPQYNSSGSSLLQYQTLYPEYAGEYQQMVWNNERERVMSSSGEYGAKAMYMLADQAVPLAVGLLTDGIGGALLARSTATMRLATASNSTLRSPAGAAFDGRLYRAPYPGTNPLVVDSYNIAASHRYSGIGEGALYFSTSERIVAAELGGTLGGRTVSSFDATIHNLLDLSNPKTRLQLGVSLDDLVRHGGSEAWRYQVTQPLGTWAREQGYNGLIAPSAQADGGLNVILFRAP